MPAFMLELEPPMSSDGANTHSAQRFLDIEEALRGVVEPVGGTSVDICWTEEGHNFVVFLRYEASHLVSAGIRHQLESPELPFRIRNDYRVYTSKELSVAHGGDW